MSGYGVSNDGSRTPALGGATPGYGGRTPARGFGSETPHYAGSETPMIHGMGTPGALLPSPSWVMLIDDVNLNTKHPHGRLRLASPDACSKVTAGSAFCLDRSISRPSRVGRALPARACTSPKPLIILCPLCCPAAHATPGRDSAWNSSGMLPAHTPAEPDEYQGQGHLPTPLSNSAGAQPTPTPQSHGATPFRASAVAGGVLGPYAQVRDGCDLRPTAPLQAALLQAVVA